VDKINHTSSNRGQQSAPEFFFWLSGTFLQNISETIPFVSKCQKKPWKRTFVTFFKYMKSTENKTRDSRLPCYSESRVKCKGSSVKLTQF